MEAFAGLAASTLLGTWWLDGMRSGPPAGL